jgi:hypothetical protein
LLVGRDPDAAFSFIKSTRLPGSPYGNDREEASQESGLELQIATHLAGTDPKRTLDIARQQLKKGYSPNLMNTLASLRPEHKDLAAQLANDIASKLLGEELLKQGEAAGFALSMMHMCRYQKKENAGSERPGRTSARAVAVGKHVSRAASESVQGRNVELVRNDAVFARTRRRR